MPPDKTHESAKPECHPGWPYKMGQCLGCRIDHLTAEVQRLKEELEHIRTHTHEGGTYIVACRALGVST